MSTTTLIISKENLPSIDHLYQNVHRVYRELAPLKTEYPDFKFWYYQKVVPGIFNGTREIIIKFVNNEIAGVAILKNEETEKKICTLRITDYFRGFGLGKELIHQSFEELKIANPLITVSSTHIAEFKNLLESYNFKLYQIYQSYYYENINEYSYNGYLYEKKEPFILKNPLIITPRIIENTHQNSSALNKELEEIY